MSSCTVNCFGANGGGGGEGLGGGGDGGGGVGEGGGGEGGGGDGLGGGGDGVEGNSGGGEGEGGEGGEGGDGGGGEGGGGLGEGGGGLGEGGEVHILTPVQVSALATPCRSRRTPVQAADKANSRKHKPLSGQPEGDKPRLLLNAHLGVSFAA